MSEHIKNIVQELNKEPFNKNFNIITFDSLEALQLLQILNDVIAVIDPKNKMDIREESLEHTCVRLVEMLQIFRYRAVLDPGGVEALLKGVVIGDKLVVYPILDWCLVRIPELQQRAYLSRFMSLLQVPPEISQDDEVARLYEQYEEIIQNFKATHKELDILRGGGGASGGVTTSDIKKDIETMQGEREQLQRRVERQRKKVESFPNSGPMLEMARRLRTQRETETRLQHQIQEQKAIVMSVDQKIRRVNQQVKEMRQTGATATPESIVKHQEDEAHFNQLMVTEKLPKEIAKSDKYIHDLERVISEPAMSQSDLEKISKKIKDVNAEINRATETRLMSLNTKEDKLIMFRQQASLVAHKREGTVERLRDVRDTLTKTETELEDKRQHLSSVIGAPRPSDGSSGASAAVTISQEPVLRGEEFKKYVAQLRTKSNAYKPKKQALNDLKAEEGVLARTRELLARQEDVIRRGDGSGGATVTAGYWDAQDHLEKVSEQMTELNTKKGATLEDMSDMIGQLTKTIDRKKNDLIPIIKELKPLRQKAQELQHTYDDRKQAYESVTATQEVNKSKLEHEVRVLREELRSLELRYHYITSMQSLLSVHQVRLQEEMKSYLSQEPSEKRKSYRDTYTKKINEQESLAKSLRERQRAVRESHGPNLRQRQMWGDLEMLLKVKQQCRQSQAAREVAGGIYAGVQQLEENRLTL